MSSDVLDVRLQYFDDCPSWRLADERLRRALDSTGHALASIRHELVSTLDEARVLGFTGSPTILLNGVDPFCDADAVPALACRVYPSPEGLSGSPSVESLRAVLERLT